MAPAVSRVVGSAVAGAFVVSNLCGTESSSFAVGAPRGQRSLRPAQQASSVEASDLQTSSSSSSSVLAVLALGAVGSQALIKGRTARRAVAEATMEVLETTEKAAPPTPPPFNPAEQVGAGPLGFFDPLGFTQVGDERGFNKLRAAEIKHGRVAMMASIGAIGQPFLKFPFFEKATGTFGALASGQATFGFFLLFVACGPLELAWREEEGKEPGNFGDPFGVNMYNEEMRNKEINNGRMAMISVLGIWAAELATGQNAIQQLGF